MKNLFIKEFDEKNPYEFRLTYDGYIKLKEQMDDILKTIDEFLSNKNLSYNDIIAQSYDYLEGVVPGFFEAFCNVYYHGILIDYRKTFISKDDLLAVKQIIEDKNSIKDFTKYFYHKDSNPVLFVISDLNNKKIFPVSIIAIKVLLMCIVNICNSKYEELFVPKGAFADPLLVFKRGPLFEY